jgi:hypothetical protein
MTNNTNREITPAASAQGAKPPSGGFCFLGKKWDKVHTFMLMDSIFITGL